MRLFLPAIGLFIALTSVVDAAKRPPVASASGEYSFLIARTEIRGTGTVLDGEPVSSDLLPVRIHLRSGAKYMLGLGSQARIYGNLVDLDGVHLELLEAGPESQRIRVGGLMFVPTHPASRLSLFSDRPDLISVVIQAGGADVLNRDGEVIAQMTKGQTGAFSVVDAALRLQQRRAPLEAARILLRELTHMEALEEVLPSVQELRERLIRRIETASDGFLLVDADRRGAPNPLAADAELPTVDPLKMLQAVNLVTRELLLTPRRDAFGCGNPGCASLLPPVSGHRLHGWAGGLSPAFAGCALCQPGADLESTPEEPEPASP